MAPIECANSYVVDEDEHIDAGVAERGKRPAVAVSPASFASSIDCMHAVENGGKEVRGVMFDVTLPCLSGI